MQIIIKDIVNVLPFDDPETPAKDEASARYTRIECKDWQGDTVHLLLPRKDGACTNTYLLADAIREE